MSKPVTRRTFLKYGIAGGFGCLAASYPFFIERYLLQINTYDLPVSNLPDEFMDFRILQLTDLHLGPLVSKQFIERVINKANSVRKDLIVCTGDYISKGGNEVKDIEIAWSLLGQLKAEYGVYSVLGNHDHWADSERSLSLLHDSGQNIRHKAISIEKNNDRIWLGGAGDLWEDHIGIDKAFKGVPTDECKILLAHNPDTADSIFITKIDLMISGHTHGGQVNIPFIGAPILPVINKKYSSGFIRSENANVFISRGIGWAIIPVRFNCPPEIAILKLKKA